MWEVALVLSASLVAQPQPQAATLEGCEFVNERWICRYRLPEIQLLGAEPSAPPTLPVTVPIPTPSTTSAGASAGASVAAVTTDRGVLSESEASLVARCAEARWYSLCLPGQREEARRLRDEAQAYETARLRIGEMISDGECEAARSHALTAGYFGLAREAQALCVTAETDVQEPSTEG